jgi:pyridoxamine 5'-phosphate oxidase
MSKTVAAVAPYSAPFAIFGAWFKEAQAFRSETFWPNAMALATSTKDGFPSVRMVLLQKWDEQQGFYFYTNYNGRKSKELEENPNVSLLFYWHQLERQIRVEGVAYKANTQESDAY